MSVKIGMRKLGIWTSNFEVWNYTFLFFADASSDSPIQSGLEPAAAQEGLAAMPAQPSIAHYPPSHLQMLASPSSPSSDPIFQAFSVTSPSSTSDKPPSYSTLGSPSTLPQQTTGPLVNLDTPSSSPPNYLDALQSTLDSNSLFGARETDVLWISGAWNIK